MKRLGAYEVQGELARGAMGVVFRAHDRTLDRPLAIKVIRSEDVRDPESQQRFLREVRILARLRHPHVIGVHSAGLSEHGYPFVAMDLIEGGSLNDRLNADGALPIDEAVRLAIQLADALEYAHKKGVLHRDVKPHNVLLDGDDAILTDFGLAKLVGADAEGLTVSGDRIGTPAYMAPEQVRGEVHRIGPATDVYALGATLYQMLSGKLPFLASSVVEVFERIRRVPADSVRAGRPEIDPGLEAIVARCLAKVPEDRYPSAGALKEALLDWQAGRGAADAAGGDEPDRRRRARLVGAGLLGLGLVAGVLLAEPLDQAWRRRVYIPELSDELEARCMRGIERFLRDDQPGAIADLDEVIAAEPDCARAWFRRGNAKWKQEKNAEALADLDRAVEIDPEFDEAFNLRAQVREALEDYAGAFKDYDRAIELEPLNATFYLNRGALHYRQEEDAAAQKDVTRSIELDPRAAKALYLRGLLKKRAKDLQGARADYDLALAYEPKNVEILNGRGLLRSELKDPAGAAADYTAAIAAQLEKPVCHYNRAVTFEVREQWEAALRDLDAALEVDPDHAPTLNRRAVIYMRLRRWADAVADMERCAKLEEKEEDRASMRETARVLRAALKRGVYAVQVDSLEMRVQPGRGYRVFGDLPRNARVKRLGEQGEWMKVQVQGRDGRVHVGWVPSRSMAIVVDQQPKKKE